MELLEKLCSFSAPSGAEGNLRGFIEKEVSPFAKSIETDALGNLIVVTEGKKREKKAMFIAHMDEVGFIVTEIKENGLIGFSNIGGFSGNVLCSAAVQFVNGTRGVIIPDVALHQLNEEGRKKVPEAEDLFIDIGAKNKGEAEKLVSLGDKAAFIDNFYENEESVFSKALDDRVGVFALIEAIKSKPLYETVFVFSTREEIGIVGAAVAANNVRPDIAFVIDSTTASDLPSVSGSDRVCLQGGGAAVSFMDKATVYDEALYKFVMKLGEKENIPLQFKTKISGGNDAGAVHKSGVGVKTAAISTPARYIHSPCSLARKNDIMSVVNIVKALSCEKDFI